MKQRIAFLLLLCGLYGAAHLGLVSPPALAQAGDEDYELGLGHFADKDYQLALEKFKAFLAQTPDHPQAPEALFKITFCHGQLQEFTEAAQASDEFARKYPQDERAEASRYNVGYYYYLAKQFEPAAQGFSTYLGKATDPELIPRALYWQGECYFELGRLDEAIASYQTVIDKHPQASFTEGETILPYALYSIAFSQFKQADHEAALASFVRLTQQLTENSPLQPEAHWYVAECHFRLGHFKEALEFYQKVLAQFPTSEFVPDAILGKGLSQLQLKQTKDAVATLKELQQKHPETPAGQQAPVRLGDALLENGQYQEARQNYQAQIQNEQSPWRLEAVWGTAESYFREENYAAAEPLYQEIIQVQPPHSLAADALLRLAFCYLKREQHDEAIRLYTQFLETHPEHPALARIHLNRGVCHEQKGDLAAAVADFEAALAAGLADEDAELAAKVHLKIGDFYLEKEQFDRALGAYQTVAQYEPQGELSGSGLFGTALVAERQERTEDAARLYEQFTKEYPQDHPKYKQGLEGAADMYQKLGQTEKSNTFRNRVLELDPKALPTRLNLAVAAFNGEDFNQVVELLEPVQDQATPDNPNGAAFWQTLGATYYQLKQWEQAAAAYGKLATDFPTSEAAQEALYWQGQALLQQQRKEAAITSLEKFLQQQGNHKRATEARLLLAQTYRETGQAEKANEVLKQLREIAGDPEIAAGALYETAWNQYDAGQKQEAVALWKQLVKDFPQTDKAAYARLHLANELYEQKNYTGAAQAYQEFLDSHPGHKMRGDAYYRLAWCQRAQGQEEAAQTSLEASEQELVQYLNAHPDEEDVGDLHYSLGWTRMDRRNYTGAAEAFGEATKRPGENQEEAGSRYGEALLLAQRYEEALQQLDQFLAANPQSKFVPKALYFRGRTHLQRKEWTAAEEDFRRVVDDFSTDEIALQSRLGLGVALQSRADPLNPAEAAAQYAAAAQEYDRVLEQVKEADTPLEAASEAQYRKAECLYRQQRYAEARDDFLRVAFNAPKFPNSDRWAGRARYMAGDCFGRLNDAENGRKHFEKARDHFQKLLEDPQLAAELKPEILYFQGLVLRALGDAEGARSLWQQVTTENPNTEWARQSQEELK